MTRQQERSSKTWNCYQRSIGNNCHRSILRRTRKTHWCSVSSFILCPPGHGMPMKARQLMQTGITTQTKRKLIFSFSDGCTAIILNLATSLFRSLSQSTSWDLALSAICTSSHYVCRRSGSFTRQHHRHHQRSRSTSLTISKRKETTSQKSSKHSVLMFANPSTEHLPL